MFAFTVINNGTNTAAQVNLTDSFSNIGAVYIGSSTEIGDGARIVGPTLIGSGCVVESGAVLRVSQRLVVQGTRDTVDPRLEDYSREGLTCGNPAVFVIGFGFDRGKRAGDP